MAVTALTVETGSGVTGADSYISLVDAEQVVEDWNPPGRATWDAAASTDDIKTGALRYAARFLDDATEWRGGIQDVEQSMDWPRYGVFDTDGRDVGQDTVPEKVKIAQVFIAVGIIDSKILRRDAFRKLVKFEKLGDLATSYQDAKAGFNGAYSYDWGDVEKMLVPDLAFLISIRGASGVTFGRMARPGYAPGRYQGYR